MATVSGTDWRMTSVGSRTPVTRGLPGPRREIMAAWTLGPGGVMEY